MLSSSLLENICGSDWFQSPTAPYLVVDTNLRIRAANRAYADATGHRPEALLGRRLSDAFPRNPADPAADGCARLVRSLVRVFRSGAPDWMGVQRCDIPEPADPNRFATRSWLPVNLPLTDDAGNVVGAVHHVQDVTTLMGSGCLDDPGATFAPELEATVRALWDQFPTVAPEEVTALVTHSYRLVMEALHHRDAARAQELATVRLEVISGQPRPDPHPPRSLFDPVGPRGASEPSQPWTPPGDPTALHGPGIERSSASSPESRPEPPSRFLPPTLEQDRSLLGDMAYLAGFAVLLLLAGQVAVATTFQPGRLPGFAAVGGLGAAVVARAPKRRRPASVAVLLACSVVVDRWAGFGGLLVLGSGLGNVGQAVVLVGLLRAWPGARQGDSRRDISRLLAAAALSAIPGALVTAGYRAVSSGRVGYLGNFLDARTSGTVLAAVTLTPLVLRAPECWGRNKRQLWVMAVCAGVAAVLADVSFRDSGTDSLLFVYVPMAFVFLAVVRHGVRAATSLPAVVAPLAVWCTTQGRGPLAHMVDATSAATAWDHDISAQIFGLVTVGGSWLIAVITAERAHALQRATASEQRLRDANATLEARVGERTVALERASGQAHLAADVSDALATSRGDEVSTVSDIAARLARSYGAMCGIWQVAPDGVLEPIVVRDVDPAVEESARATFLPVRVRAADPGLTATALRSGEVVVAGGTAGILIGDSRPEVADWITDVGAHAAVVAPMHADGTVVGTILLVRHRNPETFTKDEIELLQDLADRAGLAYANARLHRELGDSEEQFRSALENSPLGATVVSLDPDSQGRYLWVNSAFADLLGRRAEELLSQTVRDVTHPDDMAADDEGARQLLHGTGHHLRREKRYLTADGRAVWTRVTFSRIGGDRPCYLTQIEDITAQRDAEIDLTFKALHDGLTGLANRTLLMDHLHLALAQLDRESASLGVLYLDIDHFKDINDTIGHDAGDEVLQEVARRLAGCVRAPDTVSRLGGDEFVVVCPGMADPADASRVAERIVAAFERPFTVAGQQLTVTTSLGVATTSSATTDPNALMGQADQALYEAKRRGRQRWEIYRQAMERSAVRRRAVHDEVRAALEDGRMRLHYQPVVDLRDGRLVGAEALLRMEHPERGLVYPDEFIDVAEDSDLIAPLGEWVLAQACAQVARWGRSPEFKVAVNVSGRQMSDLATSGRVLDTTAAAGIDPHCITLEMTERVLIDGGDSVVNQLRRLTDAGISLAIDDFGTGYASLSYLQRFPVDTIKVDRSFTSGLGVNDSDTAIVEAIVALGGTLGLSVIAEGVEREDQVCALRTFGCNLAQGYLFARPQPPDAITALLAARDRADPAAAWRR